MSHFWTVKNTRLPMGAPQLFAQAFEIHASPGSDATSLISKAVGT